ncbi:MAG TPA: type 1 glutamine amidotransferase [Methylomusa anaerophila]|uniref:GMP synthase [glutamine-hydrolyzing] n=1 Tax=Methylomusa anaerophila TaxID=1930071 RepID=A0A348AG13_9FIRM|nr:type 1 glutamine amidotransferase [Methylomusa anaerophila]BBB90011.1 GMP synthase [glutamine-hydrolyzing] [Methylomusa anaerophila]HML88261.1 type 1 glutamine amidotransferase [Methylomusa anaerophila]
MRIHYLQHVPFEDPAHIACWVRDKGHSLTGTRLYNQEAVPAMDQFDWLVIMGGPMNIYEEEQYPWLKVEKQFIKAAIDNRKVVLGICLGAQLIAAVVGGKVTKNPEGEIGWLPVTLNAEAYKSPLFKNFPATFPVFQWHNDTFSTLGEGSLCIAGSVACAQQAFIYKERVIGFQFHLESTQESIAALIRHCAGEMTEGAYIQSARQIEAGMGFLKAANSLMDDFLNRLEAYDQRQEGA